MKLREFSIDDIESLAVGAWVLGTGGGGNPYLPLLNMRALYKEGHRVQLMQAVDLADDDLVAGAGGMGAPLVGIERMGDPYTLTRAVRAMETHIKRRFTALMSVEIGGGNGVRPLMAAGPIERSRAWVWHDAVIHALKRRRHDPKERHQPLKVFAC